jgi:hypothetical protein
MSKFGFEQFIYLSGYPNSLTKSFLLDKNVVFFLDYDIGNPGTVYQFLVS